MAVWDARPGRSLVVITADHGEAFGEHGEWSHSLFVYDTTLHVPLILRGPGLEPGSRAWTRVSLTDVAATILDIAGVKAKLPGESLRRALLPGAPDRPLYAETLAPRLDFGWSELRSWREGGYKWIRAPRPEVYAIDDDAQETRNLAVQERARGRSLDDALTRALEATGDRMAMRRADAESNERLRALGYVQGPGGRGSGADPKDKVELARRIAEATGPFRDWDDMIGTYRGLVAMDRANPLLNLRLADALLRAGKPQEALAPFGRVVASGPQNADAHVGYATALAQLGRLAEARRILEQALEIDPSSGQAHYNLAEIARVEGRLDDARREYAKAKGDPVTASRADARLLELR
jgi:tetratricopeptide (TPR) repeat protein